MVKDNELRELLLLIQKNPELLNVIDDKQMNLLHWAVKRNFLEVAQYLLKVGINKNAADINGKTALHIAA